MILTRTRLILRKTTGGILILGHALCEDPIINTEDEYLLQGEILIRFDKIYKGYKIAPGATPNVLLSGNLGNESAFDPRCYEQQII